MGSIFQDNGSYDLGAKKKISETRIAMNMLNSVLWNRNTLYSTKTINIIRSILTYGAETLSIKWKHRHKLLATEMDYLWRSARISQMDNVKNETSGRKIGMKKDILQEIEVGTTMLCNWRIAELLDMLQNGTHSGKGSTAD